MRFTLDFAVKYNDYSQLQKGIHPAGLIGRHKTMAATFLENHDTEEHVGAFAWNEKPKILQGYAYMMTHPGIPYIFWDHWVSDEMRPMLQRLSTIRKLNNIHSNADIYIERRQYGLYSAYVGPTVDKCGGTIAVKLGTYDWVPCGDNWELAAWGESWAIWQKEP